MITVVAAKGLEVEMRCIREVFRPFGRNSVTEGVYLIFCKTSRKKVLYLNCYSQFA